jgi:hypothetical protein
MNKIIPATVEHVEELASRIRRADLDELRAACDMEPVDALLMSFALSTEVFTWMHGDTVAAVFGVAPDANHAGCGCPWMIGTDLIKKHRGFFLKYSRAFIAHFNERFPLLENYVHPTNTLSIRWLEWCGFQFGEPEPYGAQGKLFLPFYKEL